MRAEQNMEIKALLTHLWQNYAATTPQAADIRTLLAARGEAFENDHIALRTYNVNPIGLDTLAQPFLDLGYVYTGEYHFEKKKLYAKSFSHPSGQHPRIFISELLLEEFSEKLRSTVSEIVAHIPADVTGHALLTNQELWPKVTVEQYESLLKESEYAGWMAAFGIRANHFTVSVNDLRSFGNLESLNAFLRDQGYRLNGGDNPIQGSAAQFLEQSSTVAGQIRWEFANGTTRDIPSCYYEFAIRYPVPGTWKLYDGFISQSADKIFESTNVEHYRQAS